MNFICVMRNRHLSEAEKLAETFQLAIDFLKVEGEAGEWASVGLNFAVCTWTAGRTLDELRRAVAGAPRNGRSTQKVAPIDIANRDSRLVS
jgi:hypothetical protein